MAATASRCSRTPLTSHPRPIAMTATSTIEARTLRLASHFLRRRTFVEGSMTPIIPGSPDWRRQMGTSRDRITDVP